MGWQIRTRGDVRRVTLLICLLVLVGSLVLRPLILPPDLAWRTVWPGAVMSLMLTAPIALFLAERLYRAQQIRGRLEHALQHDPLTGMRSRGSLYQMGPDEIAEGGCVIVADIDHFKGFNDRYGHAAGDAALRQFAAHLRGNCREGDIVARVGGEEFVLLLRGASADQGLAVARRLACRARHSPVRLGEGAINVTASFGVAPMQPGGTLDRAIQQADRALYQAKRDGRDRACLFDPGLDDAARRGAVSGRVTPARPAPSTPHRTDSVSGSHIPFR